MYKSENYEEALETANSIPPDYNHQKSILQLDIKYQMNGLSGCDIILNNCTEDRQKTMVWKGCILYKERK